VIRPANGSATVLKTKAAVEKITRYDPEGWHAVEAVPRQP
jgi:hypothetical protein